MHKSKKTIILVIVVVVVLLIGGYLLFGRKEGLCTGNQANLGYSPGDWTTWGLIDIAPQANTNLPNVGTVFSIALRPSLCPLILVTQSYQWQLNFDVCFTETGGLIPVGTSVVLSGKGHPNWNGVVSSSSLSPYVADKQGYIRYSITFTDMSSGDLYTLLFETSGVCGAKTPQTPCQCGQVSADDGAPNICCPNGAVSIDFPQTGSFCKQMPSGSTCWRDDMCASQKCSGNLNGLQRGTCA